VSGSAAAERSSHCHFCGARYPAGAPWPRVCDACGNTTWRNPIPVAVALVPVDDGLLMIRRGIEPAVGKLALPGGYVDFGETWQQGAAREVREETGLAIDPAEVRHVATLSPPDGRTVLIFGRTSRRTRAALPAFSGTNETTELVVATSAEDMAFPLHRQVAAEFFARQTHAEG
jgi:ADP-ribose pyrophosphatase YjhB (NUDIX family)